MSYYIAYSTLPSIGEFAPDTVHSYTAHNTPHDRLRANDVLLDSALGTVSSYVSTLQAQVAALQAIPQGNIVTTAINQNSSSTPQAGFPFFTASKGFIYTYTGAYVPLNINVIVSMYGGSNATCRNQYRWLNSAGTPLSAFVDFVGGNPMSGGDGGAALNWAFNATIGFIVGAKSIEFQDLHYATRSYWTVLTLTENQISRSGSWGY